MLRWQVKTPSLGSAVKTPEEKEELSRLSFKASFCPLARMLFLTPDLGMPSWSSRHQKGRRQDIVAVKSTSWLSTGAGLEPSSVTPSQCKLGQVALPLCAEDLMKQWVKSL